MRRSTPLPSDPLALGEHALGVDARNRRCSQDLALFAERPDLAAHPAQLLALIRGQALGLALVDVDLARPVPKRLRRHS